MEYTTNVTIHSDRAVIWDAVGEPLNWPGWMPEVKTVKPKSDGRADYGSEYSLRAKMFAGSEIQLVEHRAPDVVSWRADTSDGRMTQTITLTDGADLGQQATFTLTMDGLLSTAVGAVAGGYYEKRIVAQAAALRDHCESQGPQDVVPS